MYFDTSPRVLHALNRRLRQDRRVIRWTMTKLGEKVEDVAELKEQTIYRMPPSLADRMPTVEQQQSTL